MRIDVHAHYFPVEYLDRIDLLCGSQNTLQIRKNKLSSDGPSGLDGHLRNMELADVDMQILSVSSQMPYSQDETAAVDAARHANDIYAAEVRKRPKQFAAFACTPLPHIQASIEEMRRALDELGMAGVTAGTTVLGKSIADPAFSDFFAELDRRGAVLLLHPMGDNAGSRVIEASKLTWPIGAPLEDTVCLLQLMQADIPKRFPNVKIIVPHLGGFAAFLAVRLDRLRNQFLDPSVTAPSEQAKAFWYDSVNANPWALRCVSEVAGAERILLGSDYPFWHDDGYVQSVEYVKEAGLSTEEAEGILDANAAQLLGL